MSSLPTLPFLTDTTTTVSSQPLLSLSQSNTRDNITPDSNQSSIETPILRSNQPDEIDDHPASSQVWRSLLAERMARSQDDQRRLRPLEAFERAVEARRRERDAHLELAADARRREREAQRNVNPLDIPFHTALYMLWVSLHHKLTTFMFGILIHWALGFWSITVDGCSA